MVTTADGGHTVSDERGPGPGYPGTSTRRGTPATRELADITITKLSVGPMDNNAYLLVCKHTGEAVLIDAANDADRIAALLGDGRGSRAAARDHHHPPALRPLAGPQRRRRTGRVRPCTPGPRTPMASRWRPTCHCGTGTPCRSATAGWTWWRCAATRQVRWPCCTPTPPAHAHLFTGDSLFPGGPGKTMTPEAFSSLMDDLEARVFGPLPDDTWVYPGHGDDTTSVTERPQLGGVASAGLVAREPTMTMTTSAVHLLELLGRELPADRIVVDPAVLAGLSHDEAEWAAVGRAAVGGQGRAARRRCRPPSDWPPRARHAGRPARGRDRPVRWRERRRRLPGAGPVPDERDPGDRPGQPDLRGATRRRQQRSQGRRWPSRGCGIRRIRRARRGRRSAATSPPTPAGCAA